MKPKFFKYVFILGIFISGLQYSCKKKEKDAQPATTKDTFPADTNIVELWSKDKYQANWVKTSDKLSIIAGIPGRNFPSVSINFGNKDLPASTTTYKGILSAGTMTANYKSPEMDFKIIVIDGKYTISFSSVTLTNINDNTDVITCTGNLTSNGTVLEW